MGINGTEQGQLSSGYVRIPSVYLNTRCPFGFTARVLRGALTLASDPSNTWGHPTLVGRTASDQGEVELDVWEPYQGVLEVHARHPETGEPVSEGTRLEVDGYWE